MATTVYDTQDIELQDGTEITLAPLPIGRLRRFMKAWSEFANIKEEDEAFDIYINCSGIALEKTFSEKFNGDTTSPNKVLSDKYREYLEDVLDMDTIYKVLEVCGGIKLNDPKLLEEIEKAQREALGQN